MGTPQNRLFYDPSLTHKGRSGGKSDRLSQLFTYGVPIPLNTCYSSKSKNKGDIRSGGKSDRLYRLSHMVSQYLLIYSKALKARIKEI